MRKTIKVPIALLIAIAAFFIIMNAVNTFTDKSLNYYDYDEMIETLEEAKEYLELGSFNYNIDRSKSKIDNVIDKLYDASSYLQKKEHEEYKKSQRNPY